MAGVLDSVNQRTQLVGQNRLELLLFRLDGTQLYGINVFKVKEVLQCPRLTLMPKSSPVVRGVANIRGGTIPILDLSMATGRRGLDDLKNSFVIITEYNTKVQGFLVRSVERIVNMNWEEIHPPPKGTGRDHYLTAVTRVDNRMVEIIDNMLDVSRIDTNQLEMLLSEIEMEPVIGKVSTVFQTALQERNISLTTTGLADLPVLCADKDMLHKVFYHLIGTAIKYTPDGGSIMVSGRSIEGYTQGEIEVTVRDTGIGIAPENQELVFEKFYQTGEVLLHSSGKTKFKGGGPGLGLAIARGIVNAHRGRIWLESPGHDEVTFPGTTVFVRLPVDGPNRESN